jgi:hypothetical protein
VAAIFEVVLVGSPVSLNSRGTPAYEAWRQYVFECSCASLPLEWTPRLDDLHVEIDYFWVDSHIDIDNLAKPILDELKTGQVFGDDNQLTRLGVRAQNRVDPFDPPIPMNDDITAALYSNRDFIVLRIYSDV